MKKQRNVAIEEGEAAQVSSRKQGRYSQIIDKIFRGHYTAGSTQVAFKREEIQAAAAELGIPLPKNFGDVIYNVRYRTPLPEFIRSKAPRGKMWIIRPAGHGRYQFALVNDKPLVPSQTLAETKIPDATPGVILLYARTDEQALLAKLRYNRLIDIFTGVAAYSLQNHLRTTVPDMGQVETDEIYIGIDRRGAHYVFPVQAKGGKDKMSVVQIEQDIALCRYRYPNLICIPIGAQFMADDVIALFSFEDGKKGVAIVQENHYRLVPADDVDPSDLEAYRNRPLANG